MLTLPSRSHGVARIDPARRSRAPSDHGGGDHQEAHRDRRQGYHPRPAEATGRRHRPLSRNGLTKLLAGLPPVGGLLLQRPHHCSRQLSRRFRTSPFHWNRALGDVLGNHHPVGPLEGRLARQHLIGHHAQRVQVATGVDFLSGGLFRTHVHRCADGHALAGTGAGRFDRDGPRDAEVGQHGSPGYFVEQHVLRLHVPVDHAGPAGRIQCRGQVG
jgi:hypothetical protein